MKTISAFDVIGPNMIGPSSSHTAGALRIAQLARKLVKGRVTAATFTLYGSFAHTYRGHGTDRALVAGILGFGADDARIRASFRHAEDAGVAVKFELNEGDRDVHPNTVDILVNSDLGEQVTVRGVSTGGGAAELRGIDGVEVQLSGDYSTIFIRQLDEPGIVPYITGALGKLGINIAFMRLYRESRGKNAYTVIEADQEIPLEAVREIEAHPAITSAMLVQYEDLA